MSAFRVEAGGRRLRALRAAALAAVVLVAAGIPFNSDRVVVGPLGKLVFRPEVINVFVAPQVARLRVPALGAHIGFL